MPITRRWVKETELDEMYKYPERFNPRTAIRSLVNEIQRLKVRLAEEQEIVKAQSDEIKDLRSDALHAQMCAEMHGVPHGD